MRRPETPMLVFLSVVFGAPKLCIERCGDWSWCGWCLELVYVGCVTDHAALPEPTVKRSQDGFETLRLRRGREE